MLRPRSPLVLLAGATLLGCAESRPGPTAPPASLARAPTADRARAAALVLADAAGRATAGLQDATAAAELRARLEAVLLALNAGQRSEASRALRTARESLVRYAARAAAADITDRDVIAMAIDQAALLLGDGKTR